MSTVEERPLRADARRNREAIVRAARQVFAKHGSQAQIDDVARRAKVGVGTIYRHFPTKEALFAALAEARFEQLAGFAQEALADEDPWQSVVTLLRRSAEMQHVDRMLGEVLREHGALLADAAERSGLVAAADELVRRGQEAGVLRPDLRGSDLGMITCSLGDLNALPVWSWQRMLGIVLDGIAAKACTEALPD
jgi:AcrR family transcriptional regulator